ncbi:ABC transporter substrate-binding protein [Corynebacterium sputi]|uniref:ABC transporter substrate-binding protein n=1 Tax=Corynebacterium sputi TaxID=489915 RepID=UPI0004190701|nr:ABC transporter substrate-binding protein [Corynebacterium sputi]
MGTTEIESEPSRIVVISGGQLDAALSLGVVPLGATNATGAELIPECLREAAPESAGRLDQIDSVGQRTDPGLEAIAELEPDLILGNQSGLEDLYPELSKIAPTVLSVGAPPQWREDYLLLAASLGKQQQAEIVLDDLSAQAADIDESHSNDDEVVSLIRF